jgi:hypothetical protein
MQNWGHRLTEQNLINERSISIAEEQKTSWSLLFLKNPFQYTLKYTHTTQEQEHIVCETGAPWWVHGTEICWWVVLHGPIDWEMKRWYPLIRDWRYSTVQLVHCVYTWLIILFFQLGLLSSTKEESLMNCYLRLPITVLFMILRNGWWNKFHRL